MADPRERQRLLNVWRNASQLRRLIDQIYECFQLLSPDVVRVGEAVLCRGGERDTYLEWKMTQTFFKCVVMLKNFNVRIPTIISKTERELRSMMPGFPPWGWLQEAREWLWRVGEERLRRHPGEANPSGDSGIDFEEFDLRLMSSVGDVDDIPTVGKTLVIVADVRGVLHFRIFESDGRIVVDTDESRLSAQAGPIADLKKRLENLWPPHQPEEEEKDQIITAVTSIVGHIHFERLWVRIPEYEETRQRLIELIPLRNELDDYLVRIARDPCMATAFASEEASSPHVTAEAGAESAADDAGSLSRGVEGRAGGGGEEGRVPQANAGKHAKTDDPPVPLIVLGGPDDELTVCGKRKAPLPPAQYRVVKALVEAKAKGERLSKDVLLQRTKADDGNLVEDPVGALKRLRKRDGDFKQIIDMAGVPGRGYGLKDCPPTPTHKS
jgi:hypothetical protein